MMAYLDEIWLPRFERVDSDWSGGGTYVDAAWKFVVHTVEGFSRDPASTAGRHDFPPHLWVCLPSHPYRPRWRGQIVPLDRSAFALSHPFGTPETNKARAIQVEVEGYAGSSQDWSDEDLDWLASEVIGPACRAVGVDASLYKLCVGAGEGYIVASAKAPQRMGWDEWRTFNGLCGHQHVPANDHWDPGALDIARVSAAITRGTTPPLAPATEEDDDVQVTMKVAIVRNGIYLMRYVDGHPDSKQWIPEYDGYYHDVLGADRDVIKNEDGGYDATFDRTVWYMGAVPPWAQTDGVDEDAIARAIVAQIPPGAAVDLAALSGAVVDELSRRTAPAGP